MLITVVAASLMTVCSWITIPFAVPFTMQTFALFFVISLTGWADAAISVILYILLGAAGIPVFSGFQGGLGHILSPSGGFVFGFLLAALIYIPFELMMKKKKDKSRWLRISGLLSGLLLCYTAGALWFVYVSFKTGTEYGIASALMICVIPYILPDMIKLFLAVKLSDRVKKHIDLI